MTLTPTDTARRTQTPPLQGRGKGWGLDAQRLADLHKRAREMRLNPTEPELRLWRNLSNRQLHGFKFRRQEVIGNRAIVDFYCPSARLIVEVDGDTHDNPERERQRDAYLNGFGFAVLHFGNDDVIHNMDGVLTVIAEALARADGPHPNPSPEGEGLEEESEAQKLLGIILEGSVG
jgi:very-short-patch-repair endonuclease